MSIGIIEKHQQMVMRLAKPGQQIKDELTAEDCFLVHMAACLPGEASELYEVFRAMAGSNHPALEDHFLEELGDFDFYMVACRHVFGLQRDPSKFAFSLNIADSSVELMVQAGHFWDVVKRITIYRKDWNVPDKKYQGATLREEGMRILTILESHFNYILREYNIKIEAVCSANWTKLADADKGRYASGSYSNEEGQNRRDEA